MRLGEDVSLRPSAPTTPAYLTVSAVPILPIPLPGYMICDFVGQLSGEIGSSAMSLVYGMEFLLSFIDHLGDTRSDHLPDLLAFLVIVYLVVRSGVRGVPIPSILKTITRDATYYFLIIFTSHVVLMVFLVFASVSLTSS